MIEVRKATWEDADDLFKLASDSDVREASFNSNPIKYEEHLKWFSNVLKSENEFPYILVINNEFTGQIRYSVSEKNNECIIGISLIDKAKNKNIAVLFFIRSLYLLKKDRSDISKISAYIKDENIRSHKFFQKAGFVYSKQTEVRGAKAQHWIYIMPKTFIIAELSANHNHDIEVAKKTIKAAKDAGADSVKIQTYTPDTITIDCNNEYFKIKQGTIWDGKTLYDLYKEAYTPWEWHEELRDYAESLGLVFFSTPFDYTAVDFLESKNVPIYKIASFEITDIPLIEYAASKCKPMIISTGIATIADIQDAIEACKRAGNHNICLLKCTSSYPAPVDDANLKTMVNMKETFGVKAGLSDHTLGSDVAIAAVALGAEVVEKHFILDRNLGGPDASFSMEPEEFKAMVNSIRNVEKALGKVTYELSEKTLQSREFSRSLFVVEDVKNGEIFTNKNVRSIRPGYGLEPKYINDIIGKKSSIDIKKGTPFEWKHIS